MANDFTIAATSRDVQGKGASRRLRREQSMVPAIVYGGKSQPANIMIKHNEFMHALENEAFYSHILTLDIDGTTEQVILKDLQRHPYKPTIQHADFQRIVKGQAIHVHVPLHFINEDKAVGVRQGGGIISHQIVEVEVVCLPKDLPEFIEVDMTDVVVDQILHMSDLKLPEGVKLAELEKGEGHDQPVANIHMPRVAKADTDTDSDAAEDNAE